MELVPYNKRTLFIGKPVTRAGTISTATTPPRSMIDVLSVRSWMCLRIPVLDLSPHRLCHDGTLSPRMESSLLVHDSVGGSSFSPSILLLPSAQLRHQIPWHQKSPRAGQRDRFCGIGTLHRGRRPFPRGSQLRWREIPLDVGQHPGSAHTRPRPLDRIRTMGMFHQVEAPPDAAPAVPSRSLVSIDDIIEEATRLELLTHLPGSTSSWRCHS